jgi:hypothetical protein
MDLFEAWRMEEKYAKAGYKLTNMRIGHELVTLIPNIRDYDMLQHGIGVFQLDINGVTCFLVKTEDKIVFGTYNDHCTTPEGSQVLSEFFKKRYGTP